MTETEAVAGYWLPDQQLGEGVETVEVGSHSLSHLISFYHGIMKIENRMLAGCFELSCKHVFL